LLESYYLSATDYYTWTSRAVGKHDTMSVQYTYRWHY